MTQPPADTDPFRHILRWDRYGRKGKRCEIIGKKNVVRDVQVRFEDGFTAIIDRKALRRADAAQK